MIGGKSMDFKFEISRVAPFFVSASSNEASSAALKNRTQKLMYFWSIVSLSKKIRRPTIMRKIPVMISNRRICFLKRLKRVRKR